MTEAVTVRSLLLWTVLPFIHFVFWYHVGNGASSSSSTGCASSQHDQTKRIVYNYSLCAELFPHLRNSEALSFAQPSRIEQSLATTYQFDKFRMQEFEKYKSDLLVHLSSASPKMLGLNPHGGTSCTKYVHSYIDHKSPTCLAVVTSSSNPGSLNMIRFNRDDKKTGRTFDKVHPTPAGIFVKVASKKGRLSQRAFTGPMLQNINSIQSEILSLLKKRGLGPGSDVTLMVTNDGEIDLFLNYACSCRSHNISLHNAIVFTGSSELVSVIRATGAMGYYHPSFTDVPRKASGGYLDKVFVMMMWYKAFSLHIMLRMGCHVLFQDVDLVWFRDPYEYLHKHMMNGKGEYEFEAYLSDDGARAIRYSPFFANSGFYYLRSTPSTVSFSYSVMMAFDILHATGSHQNVFTFRLLENMELFPSSKKKFLSLVDFPSGVKYHHDKKFMQRIVKRQAHPYIFHMCWTANKKQKLENFAQVKMWYLRDKCNQAALAPLMKSGNVIYNKLAQKYPHSNADSGFVPNSFDYLAGECCVFEGNL